MAGYAGTPTAQVSPVHGLPSSAGVSVSSFCASPLPVPSQAAFLQSLGVCDISTVPAEVNEKPQLPAAHVRVLHSSSTPAQSDGTLHPWHRPTESQTRPPPHDAPIGLKANPGTPA